MATILAHIRVHPGSERRFEEIATELYRATHANETRVLRYEYWRGDVPGTYYTLLSFVDEDSFLEHQTSDHHEVASPKIGEVVAGLRLEWVDPIGSASPLTPTNRQAIRPDASDLWKLYHERFAAVVQDWWQPLRAADDAS